MANPQAEHGHTRIAHELMKALIKHGLSGSEWSVYMALAMDSWGRGKKETDLGSRQIASMTGMHIKAAQRALNTLESTNLVTRGGVYKTRDGIKIVRYLQKDFDMWGVSTPVDIPGFVGTGVPKSVGLIPYTEEKEKNSVAKDQKRSFPTCHPEVPEVLKGLRLYEQDKRLCTELPRLWPDWKTAYPNIELAAEVRRAHAWELTNSVKKNRVKFLNRWFTRAQDHGRPANGSVAPRNGKVIDYV